ncbi:hypothetical protein [Wolbachia endosymbiont of Chironomus riparius]|uniref:hypothetical protein n=1 Tax=Wolbachia endosymbiont of Chironomus riparius TaxID=2883238 RepID=UPI00209F4FC4|nr:hypothetical protein [Wolbachia endosymbiont of Chironomus riparius]
MEKECTTLSTITNSEQGSISVVSGKFLNTKTALDAAHKYDVIVSNYRRKIKRWPN